MFGKKKTPSITEQLEIAKEAHKAAIAPIQEMVDLCSQFEGLFGKDVSKWDLFTVMSFMGKIEESLRKGTKPNV